jgi:putative hydrolase of the HAD superfamily
MNLDKTIIFDFGGTLDTNGIHWSRKLKKTFENNGIIIDTDKFNKAFVKSDRHLCINNKIFKDYKSLLKEQINFIINELSVGNEQIHTILLNKILSNILNEIWYDVSICILESEKLLSSLKGNYKLGLVSNFYGNLEDICTDLKIKDYFDIIIDSKKVGIAKPHPGIFSLALKKLYANPQTTFVIGDSYERDIIPAKIIGCKTIWLHSKNNVKYIDTSSADSIISNLKYLNNILQTNN